MGRAIRPDVTGEVPCMNVCRGRKLQRDRRRCPTFRFDRRPDPWRPSMPRLSLLMSALLLAAPGLAAAAPAERPEVAAAATRLKSELIDWGRDFHPHPELSNLEERTSAKVAERLRAMGLQPQTGTAQHGVVAIINGGKPGPRIALRADMD